MANKKITVYIGRFQPLHNGHVHVLKKALSSSDLTIVLIGSSGNSRSAKNPFTYTERARMIKTWQLAEMPDARMIIMPLRDQPYNNAKWIQSVQESVELSIRESGWQNSQLEIYLTGAVKDSSSWYLQAFPQYASRLLPPVPASQVTCATDLRANYFHDELTDKEIPQQTFDFMLQFAGTNDFDVLQQEYEYLESYKAAWKKAPYRPVFVTVDNVVIQSGHVLVIERANMPGKGLWALPGGFMNQEERLEDAAIRELVEETGLKLQPQVLKGSIKAKEIFDDPERSLRGRTITTAFLIRLDDTKPLPRVSGQNAPLHETGGKAVVETAKAFWLPIKDARSQSERWFEDHHAILDTMVGLIKD